MITVFVNSVRLDMGDKTYIVFMVIITTVVILEIIDVFSKIVIL